MSQDFKLNIDRMLEFEPAKQEPVQNDQQTNYIEAGHYRNLCFQWPEGRKLFLSYSYLISCEHLPEDACIILEFTAYRVQIKGVQLEPLFFLFMNQHARVIACMDERYNTVQNVGYIVNEIIATKKD